ncbi:WW domain-binding protein 2 [Centruroides vittatus]|uniref:WW domain-binding protein 2 n=1 Tax=Centruroides vittatus TaxID=120091 RepID=UPI00350F4255
MSLNVAHANGGVLIFNGEYILLYCDGVEVQFEGDDAKSFHGVKKGRIYLTTHRMIFTNKNASDFLQSFSFPFFSMTSIELEQPIFGANYIKGKVKAQAGGNWAGHATFKVKFLTGGAIEFGQAMLHAAKIVSRNMPSEPPPYVPPSGPYYSPPPPAYMAPPQGYYGFIPPTDVFPNVPPENTVYMTDMPPPYPGLNAAGATGYSGNPPPAGFVDADAKAKEAAQQQAYYNPYNPSYAYVPQPYQTSPPMPNAPPPSYWDATKKQQ